MTSNRQQLRQACSADAQLSRYFVEGAVSVRGTPCMWGDTEALALQRLLTAAFEQYASNPAAKMFVFGEPIDSDLLAVLVSTEITVFDGELHHIGRLVVQAKHTSSPTSSSLTFSLLDAGLLFSLVNDDFRAMLAAPAELPTHCTKRRALDELVPYMMGAPFDADKWLETHWVTVRDALVK